MLKIEDFLYQFLDILSFLKIKDELRYSKIETLEYKKQKYGNIS